MIDVVHFAIPKELSLGLIVVIFAIAMVWAKMQGPAETDALQSTAEDLLVEEDKRIDQIDGDFQK
jgi:hypothetical protein